MINSTSDTSRMRTWLVNHKLQLSIAVHHVGVNSYVVTYFSQMPPRTILFHISKIHFLCHVISNYFVGYISFYINFYRTVMTDPTLWSLDCINYLPHKIFSACSLVDWIYLYSVGNFSSSSCCWKSRRSSWFMASNSGIYSWTRN